MGVGMGAWPPWILKISANRLFSRKKKQISPLWRTPGKNLEKSSSGPSLEKILQRPIAHGYT